MNRFAKYSILLIILVQLENPICELKSMATKKKSLEDLIAESTDGWGGPPDLIQKGRSPLDSLIKEYYYHKATAKASAKALESDSESLKMTTCTDAATLAGKFEILVSFMDNHLKEKGSNDNDGKVSFKIDDRNSFTCNYTQSEDRKFLSRNCKGEIINFGTAECWSDNHYESCGCLVYIHIKGGRDTALKNLKIYD